jgi:hypothetical protein
MRNTQLDLFDCEPPAFSCGTADLTQFMAKMRPVIDASVDKLRRVKFRDDPICGRRYSRNSSIVGSVQKRHGRILEIALREGLRESNNHCVWTESCFAVSRAADTLVNSQSAEDCLQSELPYGEIYRTIQIDVGVDGLDCTTAAYELKRANGLHDAQKIRAMRRDLACMRLLLKSYGHSRGNSPRGSDARVIFYYGQRSIPPPYSLIGAELDDHFQFHITSRIEAANCYYRDRVHQLLEGFV